MNQTQFKISPQDHGNDEFGNINQIIQNEISNTIILLEIPTWNVKLTWKIFSKLETSILAGKLDF